MPLEATRPEVTLTDSTLSEVHSLQVTETFHVDPINGEDATGRGNSWATAFRTVSYAIAQAGNGASDYTMIYLAPGVHDMNAGGIQAVDRHIFLHGAKCGLTLLANTLTTAEEVIHLSNTSVLAYMNIIPLNAQDGVRISANCCRLDHIVFQCGGVDGVHSAIFLDGVEATQLGELLIRGHITYTTGVLLDDADLTIAAQIHFFECLRGVHFFNGSAENNLDHLNFDECATAVLVDALCANNHIDHLDFIGNTVNINDSGTETSLSGAIHIIDLVGSVAPDDLTGVVVNTGGVGAWGVDTQIRSAAAATRPFYVTGITYELSVQERYQIRLSDDGGTTYFWSGIVEERVATRTKWLIFSDKYLIRQGRAIHASVRDESGGDTCTIWIHIAEI